jgi:hypothetical protein
MEASAQAVKAGRLLYSVHANARMKERGIIIPEVEYILSRGHHEARKDQFNDEFCAWDYAVRGKTLDGRNLRIVVALVDPNLLVVTTIDLDAKDE